MPLTVKDILEKTFKRTFKGYDEDEVDKFLDQIIDEFKALQNEAASLKDELAAAKQQVQKVKNTEETIMKTLISAQKTSERIINEASHKAELMISSAESTAKSRLAQYQRELAEGQNRLEELKACAQGFASSFASMVNEQAAYFEKTYRSYFGQDFAPLGGINTDALDKLDKDLAESLKDMDVGADEQAHDDENNLSGLSAGDDISGLESQIEQSLGDIMMLDAQEQPDGTETQQPREDGYMALYEINNALNELEKGLSQDDEQADVKQDTLEAPAEGEGAFSEYAWLYEESDQPDATGPIFKDPKEEEEFKTLIDEFLE